MATIIEPSQLLGVGNTVSQTTKLINTGGLNPNPQGENILGDMDGLLKLADKVSDIISKVVQLKNQVSPPPQPQQIPQKAPTVVDTPQTIKAPEGETKQIENKTEVLPMQEKKLSEEKIKNFVMDLITEKAKLLPLDYQDAKLKELTGEGFQTFKWNFKGISIKGETVVDQLVKQLKNIIPQLYEEE